MENRAVEAEGRILSSLTKEDALANAISAAEYYMKAIKLANSGPERARLKERCLSILARAEEIKKVEQWQPLKSCAGPVEVPSESLRVPHSSRQLPTREEVILLEGSKLHGLVFPPWASEPDEREFEAPKGELFTDPSKINISSSHAGDAGDWRRPWELLNSELQDVSAIREELTMIAKADIDLVQDVTADCSVVASLCAAVARPGGTYGKLLERIFYPYNKSHGIPEISKNGKYIFRLHFNGCYRKVTIDDRLPSSTSSRRLHVFDRQNPGLLWPALLEKAYLKVRGGYDFPGSNSGTDLWVLTSWIPEQVFLQSAELQPNDLWRRILKSFAFGDVMVTLGTGRLNNSEEEALGLAGEHDYAVLDIKENGQEKHLLVKNPWCNAMVWKGAEFDQERVGSSSTVLKTSTNSVGTFWMSYEEVMRNFDSLYLNWNPGLFRHRQDHHFSWEIPTSVSPGCFTHNIQFSVNSTLGGTVWILLSRHFTTEEHNYRASSGLSSPDSRNSHGFISIYVFEADGQRIHLSDNPLSRGPYVDSPQTLAKLDLPPKSCYTVVIAQQDLPLPKYSFTLSTYSRNPLVMSKAPNRYPHIVSFDGAWTPKTAGGNASAATYSSNPQFKIHVPSTTDMSVLLEATPHDLAVHIKLVWGGGARVTSVTSQDIVGESGDYRRGCALANLQNVAAGDYTIVCSTFESGQTGQFTLRVESADPCHVTPVANEDAGRLCIQVPPLCLCDGVDRMLAPLTLSRMTRLRIVAQHRNSAARNGTASPLKVSLERGQGPNKSILATTNGGDFSDSPTGVRIEDIDLTPALQDRGGVWLVVERFGRSDAFDEVQVQVFSEAPVTVGAWGTGEG